MKKFRPMSVKVPLLKTLQVFCFLASFSMVHAQDKTVSGIVIDASNNEPLIGVTVVVKDADSQIGTITDVNGKFSLTVPSGANSLLISAIGFVSQETAIGNRTTIDVLLEQDVTQLDEIVVVAYGEQKKSDITGAIASVKSEEFNTGVVTNPGQLLQGKVAGVNITNASGEPGASQNIIIRGIGSLRSGTTPLFVVDGFLLADNAGGVANNPLNFINPNDIASIEVLKDASAAALYGSRAANGVVVITTKKGTSGKTSFEFSASTAWSSMANDMDLFNADEFRTQVGAVGGVLTDGGGDTDWQDVLTQTGQSQDYNLSMSGGADDFTYHASLGIQQQEGILKNSELDRYSGKLKLSQEALEGRLNIDYNITATRLENLRPNISATLSDMLTLNPTFEAGSDDNPSGLPEGRLNPLLRNQLYSDEATNNRILASIAPSVELLDGLVYKINLGIDYSLTNRYIQNKGFASDVFTQQGTLESIEVENTNRLIENTLNYAFDLDEKHSFSILLGHSYQKFFDFQRNMVQEGFEESTIDPVFDDYESSDINRVTVASSATEDELQSFFGRVNYSFDNKYLFTATYRADGSSRFGGNNEYGFFPSLAAGWNITNEDFFTNSLIDNLKLRASWGITGNQELESKSTLLSFTESRTSQNTYPLEDDQLTIDDYPLGINVVRQPNPDLQWEESSQLDIGLDFALLDYRLTGTIDYFNKISDNILIEAATQDPLSLVSEQWQNIPGMEISNKGFELSLAYSSDASADFQWTVGGNFSKINNEVSNSPFAVFVSGSAQGSGQTGATINGYINGEPIGAFYTRTFDGIGEDGLNLFVDTNTDEFITDADRSVTGSALPDVLYGFYVNMEYKGIDLALNFNGVSGNEIYNHNRMQYFSKNLLSTSNNTTPFAVEFEDESLANPNTVSTRYLEDGSYLRLNNASLGYTLLPTRLGWGTSVFQSIRAFVTGQNLFVITDYSGFDPEVNTGSSIDGIQSFGIDRLTYPSARTFLIGISAKF